METYKQTKQQQKDKEFRRIHSLEPPPVLVTNLFNLKLEHLIQQTNCRIQPSPTTRKHINTNTTFLNTSHNPNQK